MFLFRHGSLDLYDVTEAYVSMANDLSLCLYGANFKHVSMVKRRRTNKMTFWPQIMTNFGQKL